MDNGSHGNVNAGRASRFSFLNLALWVAQLAVAAVFIPAGYLKVTTPIPTLSQWFPWTGDFPELAVRAIGLIDIAGGLGMVLPALLRIWPRLMVPAALGCTTLQVCAIVMHLVRGEASDTPLNLVLLPICAFVLWGRSKRVPIQPRQ